MWAFGLRVVQGVPETFHQAPGDGDRGLDRYLLADDGAHALLEGVEGHRQAQARIAGQQSL
ncbi:hypothetical protein D3C76_1391550 [compost metagenome]